MIDQGSHGNEDRGTPTATSEQLREVYVAKGLAELATANRLASGADVVADRGEVLAQVALVKGLPGPAEATGGAALSGADGAAADSALSELGYHPSAAFRMLSRPEPGLEPAQRVARVRYSLEAVDPAVVVALDAEAAEDVWEAFGLARCPFGQPVRSAGRTFIAVDGLEASLTDPDRKRRVWRQMQPIRV